MKRKRGRDQNPNRESSSEVTNLSTNSNAQFVGQQDAHTLVTAMLAKGEKLQVKSVGREREADRQRKDGESEEENGKERETERE